MVESKNLKPRVLMVGPHPPPPGGMANYISNLENSSLADTYEIVKFDSDYPRHLKKYPFMTILYLPIMYLQYMNCLVASNPDIVHVHSAGFNSFHKHALFMRIARVRGLPVVFHLHAGRFKDYYDKLGDFGKQVVRNKLARANRLVVLSEYWRDFFSNLSDPQKIRVVENGVPLDKFPARTDYKNRSGKNLIFVGRILPQKGMDELIDAVSEIVKIHPELHLTIVGGEEVKRFNQMDVYKEKVLNLSLEKNVTFTGEVIGDAVIDLYKSADIFVLPSHFEGMPLVLLEAMAIGMPCICTNVGAIPEVLNSSGEQGGIIIPPKDTNALKDAILKTISKTDIQELMGKVNRKIIEQRYSFDTVAGTIRDVYDELVKTKQVG